MLNEKVVLITGGTGSFGKKFVEIVLNSYKPRKLIIFSRDELKQLEMRQKFSESQYPCLRYFLGDVRDKDRLYRAFDGVDIVVHAAALKQVPAAEFNPLEAIKTNIMGAANIIDASIDREVERIIVLSTDKAVNPINLYGATKLCAEKLFIAGNIYVGKRKTRFSIARYGNVVGSRGSVVQIFKKLYKTGKVPITDERMTRFWITLREAVEFILNCLKRMEGGEVFVPKIPSMGIIDLAKAIAPECELEIIGIRPGEKLHEVMVTEDDARTTIEFDDYFSILPSFNNWNLKEYLSRNGGKQCSEGFRYSSEINSDWLNTEKLIEIINEEKDH